MATSNDRHPIVGTPPVVQPSAHAGIGMLAAGIPEVPLPRRDMVRIWTSLSG